MSHIIKTKHIPLILSLLFGWALAIPVEAQDLSKYQALFINKFIDYIAWPDDENLTIGVVGDSPVLNELQVAVEDKGKAKIKKIADASEATDCQVIFLPSGQGKLFQDIKNSIAGKGVLLVTEEEQFAWKGACISFYIREGKLRFLLNESQVASQNLKISSGLLGLAKLI